MNQSLIADIRLGQIQAFLLIYELKSISKAAEMLNLEQSTMSRRIALLEQAISAPLFDRNKRPLQPTEIGEYFYEMWKPTYGTFMNQLEEAEYLIRRNEHLSVCIIDTLTVLDDIPAIRDCMTRRYPRSSLIFEFIPYALWHEKLLRRECDVILCMSHEIECLDTLLHAELICSCPKLACILRSNPLCKKKKITLKDLANQEFIVSTPNYITYLKHLCRSRGGFEPKIGTRISNPHASISMLQRDSEVVLCDRFLRGYDTPLVKSFELPGIKGGLYAVWRSDEKNMLLPLFIQQIKTFYAAQGAGRADKLVRNG